MTTTKSRKRRMSSCNICYITTRRRAKTSRRKRGREREDGLTTRRGKDQHQQQLSQSATSNAQKKHPFPPRTSATLPKPRHNNAFRRGEEVFREKKPGREMEGSRSFSSRGTPTRTTARPIVACNDDGVAIIVVEDDTDESENRNY